MPEEIIIPEEIIFIYAQELFRDHVTFYEPSIENPRVGRITFNRMEIIGKGMAYVYAGNINGIDCAVKRVMKTYEDPLVLEEIKIWLDVMRSQPGNIKETLMKPIVPLYGYEDDGDFW